MRRLAVVVLLVLSSFPPPASASPIVFPPALGLMNSDGTDQKLVGAEEGHGYGAGRVSWSPGSTQVVVDGITIVDSSSGEATPLTGGRSPDWSPTGNEIVFSRAISDQTYDEHLYVIEATGSETRLLVDTALLDSNPSWSPDGELIAFVSGPGSGNPGNIHLVDRDGSASRALASQNALYVAPEWSPDGRRLVYETFEYRLRIIDLDAGTDQELTNFQYSSQPTWCADGTLYFVGRPHPDAQRGIYSLAPGNPPTFITRGSGPDCRSDGKLAFSRGGDIHLVEPGTAGTPNLTNSSGRSDTEPIWSPNGTKIAFSSQEEIPPPESVDRDVHLSLRRHLVARGKVSPDGAPCPAKVRLQKLRATGWRTIKRENVGHKGAFRMTLPDRAGYYRAVVPRSFSMWGEAVCLRAVSPIVRHRH